MPNPALLTAFRLTTYCDEGALKKIFKITQSHINQVNKLTVLNPLMINELRDPGTSISVMGNPIPYLRRYFRTRVELKSAGGVQCRIMDLSVGSA